MVMRCKVNYTGFQLENSNNIISGIFDRDSCSDIVYYFYDVALGQIYKNWQGKLTKLLIYSLG